MQSTELDEIRKLFEKAESELDPELKLSFLEEALDLTDDLSADPESPERAIASNLRHSNLRRLIVQLTGYRNLEAKAWFNYIKLFTLRLDSEIQTILANDPQLKESHRKFVDQWRDELVSALERSK